MPAHAEAWEVRQQLAADGAQMQRDNAALYANDARHGYQRRVDTVSQSEAMAHQSANASRVGLEAIQGKMAAMQPPVIVTGQNGPAS